MVTLLEAKASNAITYRRLLSLGPQVQKAVRKAVRSFVSTQKVDLARNFRGRPGLVARSATLLGSVGSEYRDTPGFDEAKVFIDGTGKNTLTGQPYSPLQEFGGTITAKRAAMLTIPTELNVGPDGLAKYKSAAQLRAEGRTLLVTTKGGQFLIMVREGDDVYRPMWFLRRSVYIPPRLRFFRAWKDRDASRRAQLYREVALAIKKN